MVAAGIVVGPQETGSEKTGGDKTKSKPADNRRKKGKAQQQVRLYCLSGFESFMLTAIRLRRKRLSRRQLSEPEWMLRRP